MKCFFFLKQKQTQFLSLIHPPNEKVRLIPIVLNREQRSRQTCLCPIGAANHKTTMAHKSNELSEKINHASSAKLPGSRS